MDQLNCHVILDKFTCNILGRSEKNGRWVGAMSRLAPPEGGAEVDHRPERPQSRLSVRRLQSPGLRRSSS